MAYKSWNRRLQTLKKLTYDLCLSVSDFVHSQTLQATITSLTRILYILLKANRKKEKLYSISPLNPNQQQLLTQIVGEQMCFHD